MSILIVCNSCKRSLFIKILLCFVKMHIHFYSSFFSSFFFLQHAMIDVIYILYDYSLMTLKNCMYAKYDYELPCKNCMPPENIKFTVFDFSAEYSTCNYIYINKKKKIFWFRMLIEHMRKLTYLKLKFIRSTYYLLSVSFFFFIFFLLWITDMTCISNMLMGLHRWTIDYARGMN